MAKPQTLIDYVQEHERLWGTENYDGRPNLNEILQAPVVVFWRYNDNDDRLQITLHDDLKEVEKYFSKLLFRSSIEPPKRRVARVFQNGQTMRVKKIQVTFEAVEEE